MVTSNRNADSARAVGKVPSLVLDERNEPYTTFEIRAAGRHPQHVSRQTAFRKSHVFWRMSPPDGILPCSPSEDPGYVIHGTVENMLLPSYFEEMTPCNRANI